MADNETTTVINAVDNTGNAIRSAVKGYNTLDRYLESISRRELRNISPEEWKRRTDAGLQWAQRLRDAARSQTQTTNEMNQAQQEHTGLLREAGGELVTMASRYLAVGAAIEQARQGFLGFAEGQEIMRVASARMGATREQMEKFKASADKVGATLGMSFKDASESMEAFREAAYLTGKDMGEIGRIFPGIAEVAHRFGVDTKDMATTFGSFVRQMNIGPSQWESALGAMGTIAKDLNLDFGQLNRQAPQLTEAMSQLGATGMKGMGQTLAILAMTRKEFGSTTTAARQMQQAMDEVERGGGVAAAFGMDADMWSSETEKVKAQGANLFDFYIEKIKQARKEQRSWGELFSDPRQRRFWKNLVDGSSEYEEIQERVSKDSKEFHAGNIKDLENQSLAVARLTREWNTFWKSIGGLADSVGVTSILTEFTTELNKFSTEVKSIKDLIDNFSWGKLVEKLSGLRVPSIASVAFGINNGPTGTPERRALGGPVRSGRTYMVGEGGPELFTPDQSGSVTSNNTMDRVEKHTDDTTTLLTQIRDLLYKQERELSSDGGGGRAGAGGGGVYPGGGGSVSGVGRGGGPATAGGGMGLGTPGVGAARGRVGPGGDPRGLVPFIRETAKKYGIDPDTAVAVAKSEGLSNPVGDRGMSHGAFQLYTGGGLGNEFQKETGLNPADPKNEKATIDFALRRAAKGGWGPWHGAKNTGISRWAGIGTGSEISNTVAKYGGNVVERQGSVAGVRKGSLHPRLRAALDYASSQTGLTVDVTSGGQRMEGAHGATGSHRHDSGKAGDFNLRDERGNIISPNDPRAIEFYRHAARGGVTGGGEGYMSDPNKIHLDIDSEKYGSPVYAGSKAFRDAITRGKRERMEKGAPKAPEPIDTAKQNMSALEDARRLRAELEQPITIRTQLAKGSDSQFRRASMRREVNREVREASWNSYADIGSA